MEYPIYDERKNDYALIKVNYPEYIEDIGRLRYLAWKDVEGINRDFFSKGYWIDEWDKTSLIWIIKFNKIIIASARLSIHHNIESIPWNDCIPSEARELLITPLASMNRLIVHPDFRKRGLSRPLDLVRIHTAKEKKMKTIIAEPTTARISTIQRYGFRYYGRFGRIPEMPGVTMGFEMLNL